MRRLGFYIISAILVVMLLFHCGCQKKQAVKKETKKNPVRLSRIKEGKIERDYIFTGTIRSRDIVNILPKVSGRIEYITVREGDRVKKGQVLIQQENSDLKAQLAQAQASLNSARAQVAQAQTNFVLTTDTTGVQVKVSRQGIDQAKEALEQAESTFKNATLEYNRMKNLYDRGAIAKQSLDQTTTQYEISKSQVEAARSRLRQAKESLQLSRANTGQARVQRSVVDTAAAGVQQALANIRYIEVMIGYTTIKSPIDGIITERNVEPGELIAPGDKTSSMVITDNSTVYVESEVPESEISGLRLMEKVKLTIPSLNDKKFEGTIKTIIPSADPSSRSFRIKVAVPNPDLVLKNGMSAMVKAKTATYTGLVVPRHWLTMIEGEFYISVIEDGKAKHKKVNVSFYNEEKALIKKGLKAGDEVVSTGQESLEDGDDVEITGYDDNENNRKESKKQEE